MANGKKQSNDLGDWIVIAVLFAVGIWPVALFLVFKKLFGRDDDEKQKAPPLYSGYQDVKSKNTSQKSAVKKTVAKVTKTPALKKANAWALQAAGILIAAGGLFATLTCIGNAPVNLVLSYLSIAIAGGAMLGGGLSMRRSLNRYAKYLAVMGEREAVSVAELSRTLGYSERKVEKDLQKMLDKGYFGGRAYLNMELGYLFRSSEADLAWKKQQEKKASVPKEAEEGYSGILRSIRRANDRIADPVLSAKIDRLEEITARIFREVEAHPEKQARISTFLNYYLPTTQKLLDSYADFESAGVEGENLRQAKSRIEATMDSIIRGFEHQLDALYRADAMDVASDIQVMESMLRRDTATVEEDFGLGTAVQEEGKQAGAD